MCQPVTCRTCAKTTWTGCGQHADQVLARVPSAKRCEGHADENGSGWLGTSLGRG